MCVLLQSSQEELKKQTAQALPVNSQTIKIGNKIISFAQTNVKDKIKAVLQCYLDLGLLDGLESVDIKISGDGYRNTTKTGYVVLGFVVLVGDHVHDRHHTWINHIGKHDETFYEISGMTTEIARDLEEILTNGVMLKRGSSDVSIKIDLYISADQKFLCSILGLSGPTTNFFCPLCEIEKEERHLFTPKTKRKQDEHKKLAEIVEKLRKTGTKTELQTHISSERIIPISCMNRSTISDMCVLNFVPDDRKIERSRASFNLSVH